MHSEGPESHPAGDAMSVRETFEQLPIILGGFDGPAQVFDAANAAYRAFTGRPEPIGMPAPELLPEVAEQELYTTFARVRETGQPAFQKEWRFQSDLSDTGTLQEFYLDMTIGPRRANDGSVTGLTLWAIDVTERVLERQAAQQEAAEAYQRYREARDVVVQLQQALLPTALPVLPGVTVAARYLVAERDQAAGGDWFDVVPLADGKVASVVGDIVGHGVAASAAMGQLRAVLAEVLSQTGNLSEALAWADEMAADSPIMRAATVCVAVLDPLTGEMHYSTCGHPPPLLVAADGTSRFLLPSGGGPLGTGSTAVIASETVAADAVLLLYTDGLVERPGRTLQEGMAALARVAGNSVMNAVMPVGAPVSAAERACQQPIELLTRSGYDDDVTVLAVQRRRVAVVPLERELPAGASGLAGLRAELRDWLAQLETVSQSDVLAIDLALTELVANAAEHAYPTGETGIVRIRAELHPDGLLQVDVGDDGSWKTPTGPKHTSGRGLWMIGATLDELHVPDDDPDQHGSDTSPPHPSAVGTVVTVRHRLRHPAMLASGPLGTAPRRLPMEFTTQLHEGPPRVLLVSGPVDVASSAQLADELNTASRGGMHPVVLDLTGVQVLASAGVKVLFAARDDYAGHGHPLTIVTAEGSLAAQILDLVGLNYQQSSSPSTPTDVTDVSAPVSGTVETDRS